MKTPVIVRVETGLLTAARRCAAQENRTLTNFIETMLRRRIEETTLGGAPGHDRMLLQPTGNGHNDAA